MDNFIIRQISRRGEEHRDHCEDSSLHFTYENFIFSIVMDGCSTGEESHFASSLFKKIFKSILEHNTKSLSKDKEVNVYFLMERFFLKIREIKDSLNLQVSELLSTIVISCVNIDDKSAYCIIIGDGVISVDGKTIANIEPENNAPNYLAYHLEYNFYNLWEKHIFTYNVEHINKSISICTDGIMSFKSKQNLEENFEYNFLLIDDRFINKENMFSRKCNILSNKNETFHGDDLSIIRIDFKQSDDENL